MNYKILQGDNRETLKTLEDDSIDAVVTDPPYGIDFLGKAWDANTGALETYQECLRVLKPGGHILAFSAARTYHHLAVTLEQAGFEIRDQLMWLYASGFPKAQDIGKAIDKRNGKQHKKPDLIPYENKGANSETLGAFRGKCPKCLKDQTHQLKCDDKECVLKDTIADNEWAGWKTALKPAHEPIVMARKPFKGSTIDNVLEHGVGALNIDATRISFGEDDDPNAVFAGGGTNWHDAIGQEETDARATLEDRKAFSSDQGRFPSNVIGEVAEEYQKYFYCPKVSRRERHIGFDIKEKDSGLKESNIPGDFFSNNISDYGHNNPQQGNNHPTVKPVELMKYLIKLVTPKGGTVLDPFTGSGSTGMAAVELGHSFIGCELDENYVAIAETRIKAWNKSDNNYQELFIEE